MPQEQFLSNDCNKGRLIARLSVKLESEGLHEQIRPTGPYSRCRAKTLVELYGVQDDDTLNGLRFQLFTKSLMTDNFNLASLPAMLEALRQHCLRTYLQIQMWLGQMMNELNWGWQTTKHDLAPVTTIKDSGPQSFLMATFCKCAKGCRPTCSCRN
ncbi:hypothetical protein AVEN_188695-1 [Araneus ventricosus]|uniref:Uncharacterized protein n=1 Tax=Araneus ventricosus TaxID=182803 RepID=A0A4Y2D772_ARAVE|nr:hypothetical protein AVEN_188695-1 [Araneus ventricosus]